jgi:hypothetical protein
MLDQRFGFGAATGERVEEAAWSEQIGARGPTHAGEDRALDTHARRMAGMR